MTRSPFTCALLVSVAILMPHAHAEKKLAVVDVYTSHGRPDRFALKGRAALETPSQLDESPKSRVSQVRQNLRRLRTNELERRVVRLTVLDRTVEVTTDNEGHFEVDVMGGKAPAGFARVRARVMDLAGKPMDPESSGYVQIIGRDAGFAVVSDIDDTVLVSNCLSKVALARGFLSTGIADMQAAPGMAPLYQTLLGLARERPGFFYLSGSPVNLHRKLTGFLELNGYPRGSLILKKLGARSVLPRRLASWVPSALMDPADALASSMDFKTAHLKRLMEELPDLKFILIGDSGEDDPEIYARFARDPGFGPRVAAVYIREAGRLERKASFARDQFWFTDPALVRADLRQRKLLTAR